MDAKKGDWVRIHNIVLNPEDRSPNLPEDTKKVPLEMWDKGFLLNEGANIGDMVEVESYIGRKVEGK
ncbi:2-amino-4-ketopentanoate thiolase, partial [Anaerosalibacter bizertensis]|nr:2-amino-4-ketopentanoate thiolase [Anaerosalibacter bizertensis]